MDQELTIAIDNNPVSEKLSFRQFLHNAFFIEKLNNVTGLILLVALGCIIGIGTALYGILPAIGIIAALLALPILYAIITIPRFGILMLMIMAYFLMWFIKMGIPFPIGTIMDILQALLLFGLLLKIKYKPKKGLFSNPISYIIIVWIFFNLIQVANPAAESRLSWVYTIRTVAVVMLMYFVFVYHVDSLSFVKFIIKTWLALSLFAALYALWQEYVDFLPFEKEGLYTPEMISLLFIDGRWRKFSIFSDPVSFSYNMVASTLLCIGLLTGPLRKKRKIILGCMAFLFTYVMLFSGTRGAYVLLPAGLFILAVVKMNKKILIFTIVGAVFMVALIFIPTSNYTLYRFQSAFKPSDDASFNVRKNNQKRIQPYILSHPIGGGLGATGVWGQRFAPGSFLANFPPDSGYVRVAVELGSVGLFLFCTFMFIVLRTAINNYYTIKDESLKSYSLAMLLIVFALNVANYPQEAFVQFPISIYLYIVVALITVIPRLDKEKQQALLNEPATK